MLRHTFLHLSGIGRLSEGRLWTEGVRTWEDLEARLEEQLRLFPNGPNGDPHGLVESRRAINEGDTAFFADRLPNQEHYRIALSYPRDTLFLDIETTGLSLYDDYITVVGWELDGEYGAYIRGMQADTLCAALSRA